jgi:hypothetical protein
MRLLELSQNIGTLPLTWVYDKHSPVGDQNIVSVSTKLATLPLSSMPRELNRVPARREESLEITVSEADLLETLRRMGDEDGGTAKVLANPRMTDVSIPDWSRASLS